MTASIDKKKPFWNNLRYSSGSPGKSPLLAAVRSRASSFLDNAVLPDVKDENWRYTDLRMLSEHNFLLGEGNGIGFAPKERASAPAIDIDICFRNGIFSPVIPRHFPDGVSILTGERAISAALDEAFGALTPNDSEFLLRLNDLYFQDLLLVDISRDIKLERPINIFYLFDENTLGKAVFPRVLVRLADGASAKIFESSKAAGGDPVLINSVMDIRMAENSSLEIVQSCHNQEEMLRFMTTRITQQKASRLRSFLYTDGARIYRHNLSVRLEGEGAEAAINGLHRLNGVRHADSHTFVEHVAPNTESDQLYKAVLDGESRSVFNGRIFVRKEAQLTNSYQLNKNLILGREARVDTKPQLEIFADDVKCSHGATIGQLDEDQLFYLGTRGIDKDVAVKMLIRGFIDDVVAQVVDSSLRDKLTQTME